MILYIKTSTRTNKKYDLLDGDKKYILSFGDDRYSDFTLHKNPQRQANYLSRHGKEDWSANNVISSAFMSRWLLWGKPSLTESIRDVNKRFNINVKLIT